jgi:hypothetical protein
LALAIGLRQRRVALALALAAGLALGIGIELVWDQQEGYIPLLGAAKDLDLVGRPEQRRFASVLQEFAHQTFPWAGLVVLGSTRRGFGWVASWLVVCLLVIGGWSLVYGAQPGLMSVPAAVCCAAGCEQLVQTRSAAFRRVGMIIAIGAMLVLAKDGERVPSRVVVPTFDLEGEHRFPADQLDAPDRIERLAKLAALAVLIAGCTVRVGHRRSGERSLRFVPPAAATAIVASTAVMGVWTFAHGLVPEAAAAFSPKQAIERFSAWVDAGALEEPLGTHRVDDAGFALLEMPALVGHKTREDAITMLAERERAAVLVRDADLAYVFRSMRQRELPMYVVFDGHATYRLLSNVLPKGAVDRNPILDVLRSEAPPLRHETLVRFEEFVEIIAWEFSREPIVRGSETTITVALRVLKPLPAGSKIYLRLLKDRLVHVNPEPHDFVGRVFPCNMWRPGDVIVHTFDLEMPWLETIPGEYEFVVGVQRSQRKNLTISVPQEPVGEYGVELRGSKRSFATVGRVQVW